MTSSATDDRYSRQSFLGPNAEKLISDCRLGIIGLGGGGSHVVQQAGHIGFQNVRTFDADHVEESNLNRLIGATVADVEMMTSKGAVAERLYKGLQPTGDFVHVPSRWQDDESNSLRLCDVVISCVDSLADRLDLEKSCRRYSILMIDIGMDIRTIPGQPPRCAGQIAVSMPGHHCLHCLGFRDHSTAPRYGDAGPRPQVVWSNGVLASTAVGLTVDLVTGWTGGRVPHLHLLYDGNLNTVMPHPLLETWLARPCPHFSLSQLGDPAFPPP